jgi:hypothetical protein
MPEMDSLARFSFPYANGSYARVGVVRGLRFQWRPSIGEDLVHAPLTISAKDREGSSLASWLDDYRSSALRYSELTGSVA